MSLTKEKLAWRRDDQYWGHLDKETKLGEEISCDTVSFVVIGGNVGLRNFHVNVVNNFLHRVERIFPGITNGSEIKHCNSQDG